MILGKDHSKGQGEISWPTLPYPCPNLWTLLISSFGADLSKSVVQSERFAVTQCKSSLVRGINSHRRRFPQCHSKPPTLHIQLDPGTLKFLEVSWKIIYIILKYRIWIAHIESRFSQVFFANFSNNCSSIASVFANDGL